MEPSKQAEERQWTLGRGPFLFAGRPPRCTGVIRLISQAEEAIKIRTIPLAGIDLKTAEGVPLRELRLLARLLPHAELTVPAEVFLDPHAPLGTYRGELLAGEQREAVTIQLAENRHVTVTPRELAIVAAGGETISRQVVVRNAGNVRVALPGRAVATLGEAGAFNRHLHAAFREQGKEGHQPVLDSFTSRMADGELSPLKVVVRSGEGSYLEPGDVRNLELIISLPKQLKGEHAYTGELQLCGTCVLLRVEVGGDESTAGREVQ